MRRLLALSLLLPLLLLGCDLQGEPAQAQAAPAPELLRALSRGVNLSTWFTDRGAPGIDPQRWYIDASDFQLIRSLGLRHVRIQVDPGFLQDPKQPDRLLAKPLAELQKGIAQATAEGLVVVVALQPSGEFKRQLADSEAARQTLTEFWRVFARALKAAAPNRLTFEALNEPMLESAAQSRELMQRLVSAIRSEAPRHTIVVAGNQYSDIGNLVAMQPLADPNLVYAFHFYEPHNFTHQGATWGWPLWAKFANWPYPSSPEAVAPLLDSADPEAREHLAWYGEQRWNRAKLGELLDQAGLWAARNEVPIWCNEFGAVRDAVRPEARRAWLSDARQLLDARRIPWSHWDYAGHFGLVSGPRGRRVVDPDAAAALELSSR